MVREKKRVPFFVVLKDPKPKSEKSVSQSVSQGTQAFSQESGVSVSQQSASQSILEALRTEAKSHKAKPERKSGGSQILSGRILA